eukprot:10844620-Heterocapsa_arctica.AAC.1
MRDDVVPWRAGEGLTSCVQAWCENWGGPGWGAAVEFSACDGRAAGVVPSLLCIALLGGAAATMLKA